MTKINHFRTTSSNTIMSQFLAIILLSAIIELGFAHQNPFRDPNICGNPVCKTPFNKFSFRDSIYKYEYSFDVTSEFVGTGSNASSIFLKAALEIFFPKPCEGFLRITDANLWDYQVEQTNGDATSGDDSGAPKRDDDDYYGEFADTTNYDEDRDDLVHMHPKSIELATDLKKYILRFSFHDGLITETCPNSKESVWTLNLKKGILSAFQNTMLRFDVDFNTTEIDTAGECNVKYSLEAINDVFIKIRKTKNISTCRNRYSTNSVLQTTPYNFRDDKTIWPILDSKSYCDMTINNNLYQEVTCYEQHQLIPFSNSNSGAVTKVISRLVFQDEENYSIGDFLAEHIEIIEKRSTLIFDHTPSIKPTHSEIKLARDLLKDICYLGFPNIQREFVNVFTDFLRTIKQLDYDALTQLLTRSASICEKGKNHVLDALPYIGSTASYQLMRDQLLTNSISKKMALNWLKSLSFIQRPDEDTVETFYTILEFSRSKAEPEYTLSASAVIHSYCRYNVDCEHNTRVRWITDFLETEFINIFNTFRGELRLHKRMIVILKGLGNIGILSEHFAEQLQKIIADNNAPIGIRLESVFAFRRGNCNKYRSLFLNIYTNFTIHSEVRIAAYLQTMICPDYYTINKIKNILKIEEINQVGSFVWSHLKNLAKSSSPVNIAVQSLLLNDDLSNKFKLDIRKFSRNYQQNLFFDEYNFGSTTDMNIIFGTESYLPRMGTLNFTTNLFGHSINLFELTARAEGFEQLFTSIFNSEKYINQESLFLRKGFKNIMDIVYSWLGTKAAYTDDAAAGSINGESFNPFKNTFQQTPFENHTLNDEYGFKKFRTTRSVTKNDIDERRAVLKKDIEKLGYELKYDYNNPILQFGMRIFGNDLHYYSLNGVPEFLELAKEFNILQQVSEILSGKEVTYTKSNVFLDASYIAPLMVGLPLSLDIFGASSIDLRILGELNQIDPALSSWNFDIKGNLKPTILVDVVGTMRSDIFYAQSGVKVKTTLYSNSELTGELKVRGKNLVSFSFSLPQNTSEILSARSELLKITRDRDENQPGVKSRRENSTCTWTLLDTAIGLRMCIDYSVPNLNNSKQAIYPGLILSGPLDFRIVLAKSDPTTKKWVFEYTSDQQRSGSKWAFLFYTPNSAFERSIVANVSSVPGRFNSSILFVHGVSQASAVCHYIGNPNHRRFAFLLDTNGNRSLDLNMELKREQEQNVLLYKPKMLLAINGVNITGAVGTMRINEKNGIVQSDMDFSFETRKLQMLVRGIIAQSEVTKTANITANYRFQANKIESINFEGRLINSGDKSKTSYEGEMKFKTSAHPKLNFASNITWRPLQGHTEGILAFNNAQNVGDPDSTNILHLILARSHSEEKVWEGSRFHASFDVKIPRSKIDYKFLLKHEERYKNGSEHNVIASAQFNPEKEASIVVSVLLPRHHLLVFDAFFNISVSKFNSCSGRLKFAEKLPKTYLINFNGTWFTEQSIVIKANYKDQSTRLQVLKMIIESESFKTVTLNASYRRAQTFIFSNFHVKYGEDPYGLIMQLNSQPYNIKTTLCEVHLQLKEKMYWLNTSVLVEQPLMLQMEIHLDKLRDIYIKSSVTYLDTHRELSLELDWDRNRDPSQRLVLLAAYKMPSNNKHNGQILITYPYRTVSCSFNAYTQGPKYYGDLNASWETDELVNIKYILLLMPENNINNWIHVEVNTPFQSWRNNCLDAGVYNFGTLFLANTSLFWGENQNIELIGKCDINIGEIPSSLDVRFGLNSSLVEMPSINVEVKHRHDLNKLDTDASLSYSSANETIKTYGWKSTWELNKNQQYQSVSGTILVLSPHKEFWKGGLVTKFSFIDQRKILGAASLTFNLREITLAMDGYVNKLNDNMITVNITTPLHKFRNINGRFGLIEAKRHVVAEIETPVTSLGFEVLLDIESFSNFDVKFSVATPIEGFKHTAFFAKLKKDTVDMRCKLNNVTIGFIGVWYMNDLTDFEYSCKVFTPLKDFEDNGIIIKFLKQDSFVLNLHSKLSRYSCGIQMNGKPKSPILKQLGNKIIELESKYDVDFKPPKMESGEYSDVENSEYEEFFSYNMEVLMDLLIWPTIEAMLEIEEVFDYYFAVANIKIPQGYIDIKNNLYFPDYLNIINVLNIETPFETAKIKLIANHHVDINLEHFYEKVFCIVNNNVTAKLPIGVGFEVNYTQVTDYIKTPEHFLKLNLTLSSGEEIDITGKVHLEDNLFRGNLKTIAGKSCLSLAAAFEAEENLFEASADVSLEENMVSYYNSSVYFKQEFSKVDNSFIMKLEINNRSDISRFQAESVWQSENVNEEITSNGKIMTTMLPLKTLEYSFLLNRGKTPQINIDFGFFNQQGMRLDYGMRAIKINEVVNTEIWTPMTNFKNISIHGTLTTSNSDQYKIEGVLYRDMVTHNLIGVVHMDDGYPKKARLHIKSLDGSPDGLIEIDITKKKDTGNGFDFYLNAIEDGKYCKISSSYSYDDLTGLDLSVFVQSTEAQLQRVYIASSYQFPEKERTTAKLTLETPWRYWGLEKVNLWSDIKRRSDRGKINGGYKLDFYKGYGNCEWTWIPEENMWLLIESYMDRPNANSSFVFTELKYVNPNISYKELDIGGKVNLSSILNFEVNGTLNYKSVDDIQVGVIAHWPMQSNEIHELKGRYRGNAISKQGKNLDVFVEGKYYAKISKQRGVARFLYRNSTDFRSTGFVTWGILDNISTYQTDIQLLMITKTRREFLAKFITPKFEKDATLFLVGAYDKLKDNYHYVNWSIDYPSTRRVADMEIAIQSFANLTAQINCTTPFLEAPWLKLVFNFTTNGGNGHRFCRVDWPTDFSFIRLKNTHKYEILNNILDGNIELELPINTRHRLDVKYRLNEKPQLNKGNVNVYYNEKLVVNGTYQRSDTILKETTDIIIDNVIKPIGIRFVNSSDARTINKNTSLKHIEIFDLDNSKNFNLTFQLYAITLESEKEIKLVAIHPNRTVILTTSYKTLNTDAIYQRGKLELSKTAWIGYSIILGNNNTDDNDIRNFIAELSYPKRRLAINGFYYTTPNAFNSNTSFEWSDPVNNDTKAVHTSILWRTETLGQHDRDNQTIIFIIRHHLLEKDLKLKGSFYRGVKDLVRADAIIDYSYDLDHAIEMHTSLKDLREGLEPLKCSMKFLAYHKASELDVQFNGSATARPSYFKIETKSLYKKDYFPEKHGLFLVLFDLKNNEMDYVRKSPYRTVRIWVQPNMNYPVYGINATLWNTPAVNNTGYIYVNMLEKEAHMYFNLTEDGSHNLLMFGCIPNTRSSYLNIWRNYEEISIDDVSSYIKLNHSRHLSARLHWRPKIKSELKEKVNTIREALLSSFTEHIDFWTKELYIEAVSAVKVVWETTREYNKDFVDDITELSILKEDLEDFRIFMNKSYETNDFYIKTLLNFTYNLLDEIALRDHVDSLPIIFSEIRQVLGESGKALRRSMLQLIEMIKSTYNNIIQAINNFFHGESLKYLTDIMEKGFEKYEKLVKEVHISFINHVEIIWNKLSNAVSTYFKGVLKRIEPHIFKAMSFMERTVWDLSKEVFNYINERTNELAESTYFNQVSSFTQDVENLYRDIKSHDVFLNIKKYASITWRFIKEKYHKLIPFGSELNEVLQEIWHEIKELEKIRQFQVVINKMSQVATEIEWVAEEIKIKKHLHQVYALIRNKLRNYALNALEVADMYREAKTKFIFDPEEGAIDLEQKLPISWHAFNETPKFQEIPEYKLITQVQNILITNNTSLLGHIYDFRSYLDPRTWLPQHYSRAFLIDSRFYITYDKRFVTVNLSSQELTNCSYVLSHDFWNNTFTLTVDFSTASSQNNVLPVAKFNLIAKGHIFEIDTTTDSLIFDGIPNPLVPIKFDDFIVHRDSDILTINYGDEFKIECNMQFDLCWFEVSGQYFGQTAGLLGTMNNEPFDDFMTPSNTIAKSNDVFIDAWNSKVCNNKIIQKPSKIVTKEVIETCHQLFSSLNHCSNIVDPEPYLNICVELEYKSDRIRPGLPSLKALCTAALAYIEVCQLAKIPMRVPQQCVFCELTNGTFVPESTFVEYDTHIEPRSSDVVFLVEANTCNTYTTGNKSIESILTALDQQLQEHKFINNRYAVVAFGSQLSPFNYPRTISKGNGVFVNSTDEIRQYLNHVMSFLKNEDGPKSSNDILQVISTASKLNFRPGVSKTLILLSCSRCDLKQMRFDYSSMLQYMNEEGFSLHILADTDFNFDKSRKMRHFFGFDKHFVYSNRFPEGDSETRHALHISKSSLGICAPLALETGGSVFSLKKIMAERRNLFRRFATIFAKRVVQSALPTGNQLCECTGHNTGVAYMVCTPSEFPNQKSIFEENDPDFSGLEWQSEFYELE
ncbi:uncharacterized protein LOC129248428 [Anastrepha obliqua]|uniref:uncharacterized protein LOC129248428 n=1 Tax=Anastrepha obliqua TaxID=95512 RepID=UPI00240A60B2|nr:uncharacterized protein LOC129248428 [Anastrepha obliqua]